MRLAIVLRLGLALGGAGCGSPAPPAVAADYVGTYDYQGGSTATLDCQDNSLDGVSAMTGLFVLDPGTTSELLEVPQPGMSCVGLRFDVVGGGATAQPGQVCRRTVDGITFESMFTSYKLELDSAGDTTLVIDGLIDVDVSGLISTTCTSTVSAVATKQP